MQFIQFLFTTSSNFSISFQNKGGGEGRGGGGEGRGGGGEGRGGGGEGRGGGGEERGRGLRRILVKESFKTKSFVVIIVSCKGS